jgi:hypothetical protein
MRDSVNNVATYTEAVDFLERLRPGGPWVLTAIIPDGKTTTITACNADEARQFIRDYDGQQNLYFSVNPTRRAMSKKAAKTDIARIEYLFGDLDPKNDESPEDAKVRYLAALEAYPRAPTEIIDSGNGVQVLWKLSTPINLPPPITDTDGNKVLSPQVVDDVEGRTKRLMEALGSVAGTQNVDRILRLPGTTNLPNAKKIRNGRVACSTKSIKFNDVSHPFESFPAPEKPKTTTPPQGGDTTTDDTTPPDVFEEVLSPDLLSLIRDGVPVGQRSDKFYYAVGCLKDQG